MSRSHPGRTTPAPTAGLSPPAHRSTAAPDVGVHRQRLARDGHRDGLRAPLAFFAAESLASKATVGVVRTVLNILRAVPEIIIAVDTLSSGALRRIIAGPDREVGVQGTSPAIAERPV